jgi:hypothetical protein
MKNIFLITFVSLLWGACGTKGASSNNTTVSQPANTISQPSNLNEKWDEFFEKFVSDSVFQHSRIKFPIRGKEVHSEGEEEWTAANFGFIQKFKLPADNKPEDWTVKAEQNGNMGIYSIVLNNSGLSVNIIFELQNGQWFVVERNDSNL